MTLDQLPLGMSARITQVNGSGALRRRLLDLGLTPNTTITVSRVAPLRNPLVVRIRGFELTLRLDDAKLISIE